MAHIDLYRADDRSGPAISLHDSKPFAGLFGGEEQAALRLAERGAPASIGRDPWWMLGNRRFGVDASESFADAGLEAIRRLGVAARRSGRKALAVEVEAARRAGLSPLKIDAVLLAFGRVAPRS